MNGVCGDHAIRAVTFDAGGTLLEPWPSVGAVYSEGMRRLGVGDPDPERLNRRFASVWAERRAFDYSRAAWRELVGRVLEGVIPETEVSGVFEHLWVRFTDPDTWRVFPDVAPCLAALRARGIRMAVVSNWDERLHSVLANLGLAKQFEFVLPSVEVGAPKPDSGIFHRAAARFGLSPGGILHVGDSRREDVQGAQAAGFAARWLCRGHDSVEADDRLRIQSLLELSAGPVEPGNDSGSGLTMSGSGAYIGMSRVDARDGRSFDGF